MGKDYVVASKYGNNASNKCTITRSKFRHCNTQKYFLETLALRHKQPIKKIFLKKSKYVFYFSEMKKEKIIHIQTSF
jgi:hypothetical protein